MADQIGPSVAKLGGVGSRSPFYDPSGCAPFPQVRFGNMGLNALRGPRLFNMNLRVFRKFNLRESISLRFQAGALNLTNTPALNSPNADLTTPSHFMRITSTISTVTSPQRTIRFVLRIGL